MRGFAFILLTFGTVAGAASLSPTPQPSPSATPVPTIDRLFESFRLSLPSFVTGVVAPTPSPGPTESSAPASTIGAASVTPPPVVPVVAPPIVNPVAAVASVKPENPAPSSTSLGTPSAPIPNPNAEKAKVVMDDGAAKGQADGGSNDNGGPPHKGADSKVKGAKGKPVPFNKWYPMCLFFDQTVKNANAIVKAITDMAAKCKVNLITFPVFITGAQGSAEALKQKAKKVCNATEGLSKFGVNRATAVVVTGNDKLPQQMCDAQGSDPKDISVCGEYGWPEDMLKFRTAGTGRYGGEAKANETAVAMIGPNGQTPESVAAATGQTWLGLPPGSEAGNGVGSIDQGEAAAGASPEKGWTNEGCKRMQETSFDNDKGRWKYLEDRDIYAMEPKNGKRFDMDSGKSLFARPKEVPKAGQSAVAAAGTAGGSVGGEGTTGAGAGGSTGAAVGSTGAAIAAGASATGSGVSGASDVYASGAGHKQVLTGAGTPSGPAPAAGRRELEDGSTVRSNLLVSDGPVEGDGTVSGTGGRPRVESGEAAQTARVVFDDATRRPASTQETSYETGGVRTRVGGGLLSTGGAAAIGSQITGDLPKPGEQPVQEEGGDRRPRVVIDGAPRRPGSASALVNALVKDDLKKIKKPANSIGNVDSRKPRVIQ